MRALAVCYYAPPELTPQAIQIGRQLYHLDAEVTLLHARDGQFGSGYDQYPDFFQRIKSLQVSNPGPWLTGVPMKVWRRVWPLYAKAPDLLGRWRARAVRAALDKVAQQRPDVLVSFGMPMSDHLVGYEVQRATGLPWLVHFSDPWTDNPFHDHGAWAERINYALERKVIGAADRVLFTSQRTLEQVMRKYPDSWRAKADVLPHAWDMEHFAGAAPQLAATPGNARHVIRHIGAFYGARSPEPLFQALQRIATRTPELLRGIVFELVGPLKQAMLETDAYRALPPGLVQVRGPVGYRESLELARSASALLVIDAPSALPSVFLPSKLVEYIGANRPVLGITPPGTSFDLIGEWAEGTHACASPDDVEAITRMLTQAITRLQAGSQADAGGPAAIRQRFAPARVSGALREHLLDAIAQRLQAPRAARVDGALAS